MTAQCPGFHNCVQETVEGRGQWVKKVERKASFSGGKRAMENKPSCFVPESAPKKTRLPSAKDLTLKRRRKEGLTWARQSRRTSGSFPAQEGQR